MRIPNVEGLVLFRFFDVRIALTFLASLAPSHTAAFVGAQDALTTLRDQITVDARLAIRAEPGRVDADEWHLITPVQMTALSEVAGDAFVDKFRRYMREIWWDRLEGASDLQLDEMRENAIATAQHLELPLSSKTIVTLALVELTAPQVIRNAPYIIDQIRGRMDPDGYALALLMVAKNELDAEAGDLLQARSAYWNSFR